jgi:hypothetical protein
MTQLTIPKKYVRLRERVQKVEEKLRSIVGDPVAKWFTTHRSQREYEKLIYLLNQRLRVAVLIKNSSVILLTCSISVKLLFI